MAHCKVLTRFLCGLFLLTSLSLSAQNKFVLVTSPSKVQDVCGRHGLTQITQLSQRGVVLVSTSSPDTTIATDSDVLSFDIDRSLAVPELSDATIASLTQSTSGILDGLPGRSVMNYFGAKVPSNYVQQPATALTRQSDAQNAVNLTGSGVTVALIDTGVDPNHPALSSVLLPGYNFINESASSSE